jgi:hypothetical protein
MPNALEFRFGKLPDKGGDADASARGLVFDYVAGPLIKADGYRFCHTDVVTDFGKTIQRNTAKWG